MNNKLDRFIKAHERDYENALLEIKEGRKKTHWMWYVFPQIKGLGNSATSEFYSIDGIEEASLYYNNKYLREHLIEISQALLDIDSNDITNILGFPDNLKLQSSMTLFSLVDPKEKVFSEVLSKYYNGEKDMKTVNIINCKSDYYK
jgi:uncharacterized protein (DUF1810 family)